MMTPAQQQKIATWAEQRDTLIREIGILETEKAAKTTTNIELGSSNAELEKQIAGKRGILSELEAKEERFRNSLATDIVELATQKSRLEAEIQTKRTDIRALDKEKISIIETIGVLTTLHQTAADRVDSMDQIFERSRIVNEQGLHSLQEFLATMKTMVDETSVSYGKVMEVNTQVLDKLPQYIFQMEKQIIERHAPLRAESKE